jgi:hypothetical protein
VSRPAAVEITAEGLDRIPGSHEGDVFEVKLFSPAAGEEGEVAHVLDEHGSTWSLGVGDWRPAPNAVELPAVEKRIEIRADGLDVRSDEDGRISIRLEAKGEGALLDGYVSISGTAAQIRAVLARALSVVNAVDRAALELDV